MNVRSPLGWVLLSMMATLMTTPMHPAHAANPAHANTVASSASPASHALGEMGQPQPLSLERTPEALPSAVANQRYGRAIRAEGGQKPLHFSVVSGALPEGLALSDDGRIEGTPAAAGRYSVQIHVRDASGHSATQAYVLRVLNPSNNPPSTAGVPVLTRVDLSAPSVENAKPIPTAKVYQLTPAVLEGLKDMLSPPPEAVDLGDNPTEPAYPNSAASASTAAPKAARPSLPSVPKDLLWSPAQQEQLALWLQPLLGVEYPHPDQFLAALDARVCAHVKTQVTQEALRLRQQPPSAQALERQCQPGSPAQGLSARKIPADPKTIGWQDLPAWLLPPPLRTWLVRAAEQDRPFTPGKTPVWRATEHCACADARVRLPIFAVAPMWSSGTGQEAPPPPTPIDFSLIQRITALTIPFDDDLILPNPAWNASQTEFIAEAHRHDTRVDFGIYRRDWRFLATEPAAARESLIQQLITQAPIHARTFLDRPLPGWSERMKAWLPGWGEVQRTGDGLTIYVDHIPDPSTDKVLAERFADFYPRFILGLAAALKENRARHYAINLVVSDRQMRQAGGPVDVIHLFELMKAIEEPEMANGRILSNNSDYKRNSNLEMRVLVMLSEPTTLSKKQLRSDIENSPTLKGDDRRVFLRSVVPLLMLPQRDTQQYTDDLVYVQDNFGGIGFWPSPAGSDPGLVASLQPEQLSGPLRTVFVGDPGFGLSNAVCGVVCPNRWILRTLLEVMLLLNATTWLVFQWQWDWRIRYGRIALLGIIPPALLGAALLQCDPALAAIREGNAQTFALIAIFVATALSALLKRRVEKP